MIDFNDAPHQALDDPAEEGFSGICYDIHTREYVVFCDGFEDGRFATYAEALFEVEAFYELCSFFVGFNCHQTRH